MTSAGTFSHAASEGSFAETRHRSGLCVILYGMKHCGKSTLGRMAAGAFSVPFHDLDDILEEGYKAQTGRNAGCREIYRLHGESFFRKLEITAAVQAATVLRQNQGILALGGGTPENREAAESLHDAGVWIYLEESPGILYKRIVAGGLPPFLQGEDPEERFQTLYRRRTEIYTHLADRIVPLGGGNIEESFAVLYPVIKEYMDAG